MNRHWFMIWVQNCIQWLCCTLPKKIYTSFLESYDLLHTREDKHIWFSEFQVLLWFLVHIASYFSSLSVEALSELWIWSQGITKNINSCRISLLFAGFFAFKRNMESTKMCFRNFIHNNSNVEFVSVFHMTSLNQNVSIIWKNVSFIINMFPYIKNTIRWYPHCIIPHKL